MTDLKKVIHKNSPAIGLIFLLGLLLIGATSFLSAGEDCERGYLGVHIEKISSEDKEELGVNFGLLVVKVIKGEAAEKAGIQKYDVIQYLNDEKMRRYDDLVEILQENKPGTQVKLRVIRDKKEKTFTVTLGKLSKMHFHWDKDKSKDHKFNFHKNFIQEKGGYLGVYLQDLNQDLAPYFGVQEDGGALILNVQKDTPAEKAGLKAGDVITKFADKKINSPLDLKKMLSKTEKGEKVELEVMRHKKKKTITVELDENQKKTWSYFYKGDGDNEFFIDIPKTKICVPKIDEEELLIFEKKIEKKIKENTDNVKINVHQFQEKMKTLEKELKKKLKKLENYASI